MASRIFQLFVATAILALTGCQNSGPPTDPEGLRKEADKVKKEAEKEWENK